MRTPLDVLPAPRTPGPYRVATVCLGNICRSPVAQVVLEAKVAGAGLSDRVEVVSSGTADWHVGKTMDPRSAATLTDGGYDATRHRAQQFTPDWHDTCDLVLVMDHSNRENVGPGDRVHLFREFDPTEPGAEVPDPYYGGEEGFTEVLAMVERTADHLVTLLARTVGEPTQGTDQ